MKLACRAILLLFVAAPSAFAVAGAITILSRIGPAKGAAQVTLAAGGTGVRNCLSNVDANSDAQFTFRILDGGTTIYAVVVSSGSTLVRSWDLDQLYCGTANTAMYMYINGGNYSINYQGFTY